MEMEMLLSHASIPMPTEYSKVQRPNSSSILNLESITHNKNKTERHNHAHEGDSKKEKKRQKQNKPYIRFVSGLLS